MLKHLLIRLLTLLILINSFSACEKSKLTIDQPTIVVSNESPKQYEEIEISVVEYAELDGIRVIPEHFDWTIEDSLGNAVYGDIKDSSAIFWIPEEYGFYTIKIEIGYGEKQIGCTILGLSVSESNVRVVANISINKSLPIFVGQDIQAFSTVYAYLNSKRIVPESHKWTIEDSLGNTIKDDFDNSKLIVWIPEDQGTYTIKVEIGFAYGIIARSELKVLVKMNLALPYLGDYHFKRIINFWTIQGSRGSETKYYDGFVEAHPDSINVVKIRCGDGAETTIGWVVFTWDEYFSANLLFDENMQNPSFQIWNECPHLCFYGRFIGLDSLFIYRDDSGLGGGRSWTYYGSKIK